MKIKKSIIFSITISTLFLIISCNKSAKKTENDESPAYFNVRVEKVIKGTIKKTLSFTGTVEPEEKVTIIPDIGGKIHRIYVKEGDRVKQGQVLAELDTRHIRLQLEQAKAALDVAEANFKDAERNLERMNKLKSENAVSDQQFEKVRLVYEGASSQLQQTKAALNLAQYQLDVSIMKAPFDGIVSMKIADEGDVINPMMAGFGGRGGVLVVMNFSKVKINLDVSDREIKEIKKGDETVVKIDTYPEKEFIGKVSIVNLTADPLTKTFNVQVEIPNKELFLKPGVFAKVTIITKEKDNVLVLNKKALIEGKYVFVVKENRAEKREVLTGLESEDFVELLKGIGECIFRSKVAIDSDSNRPLILIESGHPFRFIPATFSMKSEFEKV
ncbi:MAG: efflux RND transporter periplasmic adaptor subunit, partial [Acidobacteriota bacterium]